MGSSDEEERKSRRRHKDSSRKKKSKRSSRPREEGQSSSRRNRRFSDGEEDENDAREGNVFTRGIPAPPLAQAGASPLDDESSGFREEEYLEQTPKKATGDFYEAEEDGYGRLARRQSMNGVSSRNSGHSELKEAIDRCEWELVNDITSNMDKSELKRAFEATAGDLHSTLFQDLIWKAPVGLVLHFVSHLEDDLPNLSMGRDRDGNTALHLFCANVEYFGQRELSLLSLLVKAAHHPLQMPNRGGDTPLHLLVASNGCISSGSASSAEDGAVKAVSLLMDESIDAAIVQDASGATPLHVAIAHGAYDKVLLQLLEKAPVASKVSDEREMLPLHYAAAFWQTSPNIVETLVDVNPDALLATTVNGDTPLHLMISNSSNNNIKSIEKMVRVAEILAGMDDGGLGPIVIQNSEKLTPVHCCALFDAPSQITRAIMRHPMAKSASLTPNMFGATALHMAVAQPSVVESLGNVVAIASTDAAVAEDRLKRTPLHVAAQNANSTAKLIQLLYELCPEATTMRTQRGHLPLHLASQSQANESVIKALLQVDPKAAEVRNKSNNTPLHDAAKYRASPRVVQLLMETYPDAVYIQNQYGNLPLHCATAYQAPPEVVELLLEAWSDGAAMQNRNQDAPLHYAAAYTTSIEMVRPLIEAAPAAVLLLNSSGQSPLDRAKANHAPQEIIDLLEKSAKEWTKKAEMLDTWGDFDAF